MKKNFDVSRIREDFPLLKRTVNGRPLVYFDNAATALKPRCVVERIQTAYLMEASNIHRGVHFLSEKATAEFEEAREKVAHFIAAQKSCEIVFTKGATDAINLVAFSYGRHFLKKGDVILISHMEHHSNIVPWQILCEEKGCKLEVIPINERGEIDLLAFESMLTDRIRFLSLVHISNSLGTVNPIKEMIQKAHLLNIPVLVDGAQSICHTPIDVGDLDCDFFVFSGHKLFGPTGVGVLYGKEVFLEKMPPFEGGGDMILNVSFEKTTYNKIPYKFEAGTPHIVGVIGLGVAIDYFSSVLAEGVKDYERELLLYLTKSLKEISGLRIIGEAREKISLCSFILEGVHPHDIGSLVNDEGIAIRTGHHCTEPVMKRFSVSSTARASLSFYNSKDEIDRLVGALVSIKKIFKT